MMVCKTIWMIIFLMKHENGMQGEDAELEARAKALRKGANADPVQAAHLEALAGQLSGRTAPAPGGGEAAGDDDDAKSDMTGGAEAPKMADVEEDAAPAPGGGGDDSDEASTG